MKTNRSLTFSLILAVLFVGVSAVNCIAQGAGVNQEVPVSFEFKTDKLIYTQGEVVSFLFEMKNKTNRTIAFEGGVDVYAGKIVVSIADGSGIYKPYYGIGWGLCDVAFGTFPFKAGEVYKTDADALYNQIIEFSSKERMSQYISTPYAFQNTGTYKIKATGGTYIDGKPINFEPEPVTITVVAPTGEDWQVWNKIKGDARFAYLLQRSDFLIRNNKEIEVVKFQDQANAIINQFPNSSIAARLQQSLTRFKAREAELLKIRQQNATMQSLEQN